VGRDRDLVISGGFNIYPLEVERIIDACPGVTESAVIGLPHPDLGEATLAVVVPESAESTESRGFRDSVTTTSVRTHVSEHLAPYKRPREIVFRKSLPRNAMGKVQKNLLKDAFREVFQNRF